MDFMIPAFANDVREMNQLMSRWFGTNGTTDLSAADWVPKVDIDEDEKAYTINAEIPDVKRKDVKISIEDGMLTLSGERKHEKEEKSKKYHRVERSYGSFLRSFALPADVDESKIKATFADGMLHVVMPKGQDHKKPVREIPVA
jgi:HSP20 family protein